MTFLRTSRAVLLGLAGAGLVCGVEYFNDIWLGQTMLISNNMPLSIYGSLILILLIINPLLYLLWKRLALSGGEVAIILMLTLAACCIPGSTLMRHFTCALIMPHHHARKEASWKERNVLQKVPPYMLADVTPENESEVLNGFVQGLGKGGKKIAFYSPDKSVVQVPWYAWTRTLAYWLPFLLVFWIALLGLSLVVHRQWADHEQLPYPIATFVNSLLPKAGEMLSATFRSPLFWLGALPVLLLHLNNYAAKWFPASYILPTISLSLDFKSLEKLPLFQTILMGGGTQLTSPTIVFAIIALAYFIPADVSLALGLSAPVWALVAGTFAGYGLSLTNGQPSQSNFLAFGAYVGALLFFLYVGRRYYVDVLKEALFLTRERKTYSEAVWGARVFLVAITAAIIYACTLGQLDWQLAIMYIGATVLIMLVLGRVIAETGLFFLVPSFVPYLIILGIFGPTALGPHAYMMMLMLSTAFFLDPRDTLMPFVVNSLKLLDMQKVKVAKVTAFTAVALIVGIGVAVPVTLYWQYSIGANMADPWATVTFAKRPFDTGISLEQRLEATGRLAEASAITGWGHFGHLAMDPKLLLAFAVGLGLMLLCTVGRLRFSKWPLHPVFFLMWNIWSLKWVAPSFFLGWLVKVAVTKYGGMKIYQQLKPLMIGLIAGEMLAGITTILIGWLYYAFIGQKPQGFSIYPF